MLYSVRRRFLFLWLWRVEAGGKSRAGLALTKRAAKRAARACLPKRTAGEGTKPPSS